MCQAVECSCPADKCYQRETDLLCPPLFRKLEANCKELLKVKELEEADPLQQWPSVAQVG